MANQGSKIVRFVKPIGNLLNDNDSGVDQLGYIVYAQALAKLLHNCRPPITVGIFAPWGNGKTFLLKHVQGLLRKYERQHQYDVINMKSIRDVIQKEGQASVVDKDDEISTTLAGKVPENKTRKTNCRRFCVNLLCTLACLLIIVILCLVLMVALLPTFWPSLIDSSQNSTDGVNITKLVISGRNGNGSLVKTLILSTVSTTARNPPATTDATDDTSIIQSNVRLYLILAVVATTAMLFTVFCCCVSNTNSKCWRRFTQHFSVVLYAAFTRLPSVTVSSPNNAWIEADDPYMVVHINDEEAELRSFDPEDEENYDGFHLNAMQVNSIPVKYIFVNYHAWQYAGSDTLWAGIVTNLSDAIEKEFGAVTTRLFRMMQVERPSKSGPIKAELRGKEDPRAIYVRFYFPVNDTETRTKSGQYRRVFNLMTQYGVVTQCCHLTNDDATRSWWYVRFSSDKESNFADSALKKVENFEVRRRSPDERDEESSSINQNTENRSNNIQMDVLNTRQRNQPTRVVEQNSHDAIDGPNANLLSHPPAAVPDQPDQGTSKCCSSCCCCCRSFSHFRKHPKTVCCGCPYLYCCILFVVAALIFPITVAILVSDLELGVMKSTRAIPIEVQIFSWLPTALGVFVIAFRFCWAMCHSQTERIRKALAGTEGNMATALGFMNDVKNEVKIMTQLINCVRFTHQVNYKVVITIDDLDRCPNDKVKSVLEAVSILLSDRSSPFLCLIAVDSRVAVKCIEQDMGEVMLQANLTGHEYLKKIINLPFCLPEVADRSKKKYVSGMMDIADRTKLGREKQEDKIRMEGKDDRKKERSRGDALDAFGVDTDDDSDDKITTDALPDKNSVVDGSGGARPEPRRDERRKRSEKEGDRDDMSLDHDFKFLFECRKFIHEDKVVRRHMCGNPRNIKRIFNVLSLTTHMMGCIEEERKRRTWLAVHSERGVPERRNNEKGESILNSDLDRGLCYGRTKQDAEDLVRWIVLTDQWPYRMSYILQVIEDSEQRREAGIKGPRITSRTTLSEIYEKYVEPEIATCSDTSSCSMLTLDEDPSLLRSLLRHCKSLTRHRVFLLFPVTLNLDQSLRNGISRKRYDPKPPAVTSVQQGTTPAFVSNDARNSRRHQMFDDLIDRRSSC